MKSPISLIRVLTAIAATVVSTQPVDAKPKAAGKEVFQQYCVTCHVAGGNLVKPSKAISSSKKLGSYALFKAYLYSPTGHMPYYHNLCKDEKMLKRLYDYVKTLESIKVKQAMVSSKTTS
jgi:mono/diheme cytochrome c family protein